MKTTSLVTLGLLIAVSASACKVLARGLIPHLERWSNGLTKREGRIEGDAQTGEWTYYYESGQRRANGHYDKDHQVGSWTYWFENGGVEWSGAFDPSGKRSGEWTFYYPDSTMRARGRYVADFEDGPWEFFGTDGAIERTGQYDAGKMSGPWAYFHPGGRPKAQGFCFRGQRIGAWQIHDEAGNVGVQDFGSRPGVEIALETWPSGARRRMGALQNGAAVGRWTSWHENGTQRFCCTMAGGRPSGVFEARDANGQVTATGLLHEGAFVAGTAAGGIAAGPLPTAPGEVPPWSADAALAALQPELAVAVLCAETSAPVDAAARAPKNVPTTLPAPTQAAVVAAIEQQQDRIPSPVQPALTVGQEKELESIVENYKEGQTAGRPSLKKYPTDTGNKPSGPRQLTELEGKPLPVDVLKGVDGTDVDLRQFRGKKKVLLVVLRGFLGEVCVYCVAQTEALAQCRAELDALGIEVLVLYPGARENEESFEKAYAMTFGKGAPPYKVFYDPDLEIVQKLGISGDLAYPSTLIVDQEGIVQYAYVGKDRADRPAARALIRKIKELKQ